MKIFAVTLIAVSAIAPLAYADEYDADGNLIVDEDTTGSVIIQKQQPTIVIRREPPTVVIRREQPAVIIDDDDNGDDDMQ